MSRRSTFVRCTCAVILLSWLLCHAASTSEIKVDSKPTIDWSHLYLGLFAGLALFLYGLELLSDGLKTLAGNQLKNLLQRFTSNRFKAALTGGAITALVQSSSITTVLTVGFVSAGLMSLTQSVGVIMGANVGSTLTAQIIAFDIEQASLALITTGFAFIFISRKKRLRHYGKALLGLGLLFYGMNLMSSSMTPLHHYPPFLELMSSIESPLFGILIGALFTALVQSSSATTGIVIVLASQNLLSLPAGIALIFGANIGTCVTALLASLGKNFEAKRVACVHIIFNLTGVLLWLAFIPQLASWVDAATSNSAFASDDLARQIANAHSLFNLTNTLLLLPLAGVIAKLAEKCIPEPHESQQSFAKFLNKDAHDLPSVAVTNARLETARLGEKVYSLMLKFPSEQNPNVSMLDFEHTHSDINQLYHEIHQYLSDIHLNETSVKVSHDFQKVMVALEVIEGIAQLLSKDLNRLEKRKGNVQANMSDTLNSLFFSLHKATAQRLSNAISAFLHEDQEKAKELLQHSHELNTTYTQINHYQEQRFAQASPHSFYTFKLEMRLLDRLRHIHSLCDLILESTASK
ncbi:Na/Pi cotransporter family protein [Rubritalea spongiae]|uniref:Na/Pi cotransporter family protein n=1 Tax=Rubritalea spongiae TaxID=430797 RepID=A0ABW5E3V8_9BACT